MRARPALSFVLASSLSLGSGWVSPPAFAQAPAGLTFRVGQADGFSHIEFVGAEPHSARRDGRDLVLLFPHLASADVSALRVDPPKYLKTATAVSVDGGIEVRLTLADGADARVGRADGGAFVNLSADPFAAQPEPDQAPDQARTDPVPASRVVKMHAALQDGRLVLRFPWAAPLGAAAFRRGGAIWLVFDAQATVDLSEAPRGLPQARRMDQTPDAHAAAIRIVAPPEVSATLSAQGGTWTLVLGPATAGAPTPVTPTPVEVKSDLNASPAALTAQMAGATGVFWISDPAVGDHVAVVTALGPVKGVATPRAFVDATVLASFQGMAVEARAPDLTVTTDADLVRIGRPGGLALSSDAASIRRTPTPAADLPQPAAMPGLVDFADWPKTGPGGFLARYDQLQSLAAEEAAQGKTASARSRLALARFLVGSQLSFEAIGVLDLLAKADPLMLQNPELRGLRGAAKAMAGRYKDAEADLSAPVLAEDPASALWRAYCSSKLGDWAGARQSFASGRSALTSFSPDWRAHFARADAEAALAQGDVNAARGDVAGIAMAGLDPMEAQAVRLDQARVLEASGQPEPALRLYDQVAAGPFGSLAAPALLHATEIRLNQGGLKTDAALAALDSLRFRWRGDDTELDTVRELGRIYIAQGRYREALDVLRSASRSLPDAPAVDAVQADLSGAFHSLFLDGGADGLPPIQALGLFLDYKELTPIGADGDLMVRKLAHRLVDVDLLDQAAQLLKYQADNRLDGVGRAQVDTDLAMIDLMNRQPEAALDAINGSRSTLLPPELNERRRLLQARALSALGRYDDAAEFLENEKSADAAMVHADIAWDQKQWATAGALFEAALADRWKSVLPLQGEDEARLLRAAIAYSLAPDDTALARLRQRYEKLCEGSSAPMALKVALAGVQAGPYAAADYARAVSESDDFQGWVQQMKVRYLASSTAKPPGSG